MCRDLNPDETDVLLEQIHGALPTFKRTIDAHTFLQRVRSRQKESEIQQDSQCPHCGQNLNSREGTPSVKYEPMSHDTAGDAAAILMFAVTMAAVVAACISMAIS